MDMCTKLRSLSCLSVKLLYQLGNQKPTRKQMDLMENLVAHTVLERRIGFDGQLTGCEIKGLYLAAKGMTSGEAAELLGVKTSTIESHRKEIKRKLVCRTLAQAVFEGVRLGYMETKSMLIE